MRTLAFSLKFPVRVAAPTAELNCSTHSRVTVLLYHDVLSSLFTRCDLVLCDTVCTPRHGRVYRSVDLIGCSLAVECHGVIVASDAADCVCVMLCVAEVDAALAVRPPLAAAMLNLLLA